ncbi:1-acyl-sn-glycerol-3-phosphate acyltransferase [Variovorax terrae]|uniref:1-acyl-sn-glycerol-3-phosphate acyltransferase n=1 Tax=Variovorax terrae TaxID=2923278 RepID=A0A9X2AMH6_9BURK|nr:1-acyl-sn-glycerol-3-phosphate acyltransferase [Variovorax terrae]MCJ0763354.1 1-acyl-sn-glycerol-3-phosphate acyltransferase [Variovorax terrae]
MARALLRLLGWRVDFRGLPAPRGVLLVYPHTSNWDFCIGILAKWAIGLPVRFWGKDSLFRVPLFGRWLRWVGGVPVDRTSSRGAVAGMAQQMLAHQHFWLALSPEGTRRLLPGWRSGFYRLALQAGVPLGMAYLDYAHKRVGVTEFFLPGGDESADLQRIARAYAGREGLRPALAAPIRLLDAAVPRTDTIVK